MASRDLLIEVTARDNASRVFEKLGGAGRKAGQDLAAGAKQGAAALDELNRTQDDTGQSAVEMIQDVDRASDALGRDLPQGAGRAEQALNELDRAQDQAGQGATELGRDVEASSRSMRDFGDAGQRIGAGLALLGASFAGFSTQAFEQQQIISSLQRQFGDAAGDYLQLADTIAANSLFNDDDILRAETFLGTLRREYGVTDTQLQALLVRAADLAQLNPELGGVADVTQRLTALLRGEAESAEALGIAASDSALGIDRMSASTTNAEKVQIRFEAAMAQTEFAANAASEAAQGTAGRVQNLSDTINDSAQSFAAWTGPIGQSAAMLADFGLQTGLALAGSVQLARGIRELNTATAGVGKFGAAFGLLTNPITIAGVAVAGLAALTISDMMSAGDSVRETQQAFEDLGDTIGNLPKLGATPTQTAEAMGIEAQIRSLEELSQAMLDANAARDTILTSATGFDPGNIQLVTNDAIQLNQALTEGILTENERQAAILAVNQALTTEGANLDAVTFAMQRVIAQHQLWLETSGQMGIDGATMVEMLQNIAENADTMGQSIEENTQALLRFSDQITATEQALAGLISGGDQNIALIDQLLEMQPILDQIMFSIATFTRDGDLFWGLTTGSEGLTQLEADLNAVLTTTGLAGAYAQQAIENLNAAHQAGILSADEYAAAVHYLATTELPALQNELVIAGYQIGRIATDLEAGVVSAEAFGEALGLAAVEARAFSKDAGLVTEALHEDTEARDRNAGAGRYQADALYEVANALDAGLDSIQAWAAENAALTEQFAGMIDRIEEWQNKLGGGRESRELTFKFNIETDDASARSKARPDTNWLDGLAVAAGIAESRITETTLAVGELGDLVAAQALPWMAYQQALAGVAAEFGLLTTNAQQFQAVGLGGQSVDVAVNLQMGGGDLDRIFNTIVGQTNQMSQQMGSVDSWADKLIGDPGTWSQLDDLLAQGRISLEQYNAAQKAQVRISTDVENAQWDLLAVQANLAPVIADATRRQAEYIDGLQDLDTNAQLAALGFMDQAQSARALEIAQLAAASSTEAQRDATTDMITEMVAADPVLGAMLEKMGLISYGAKGEIIVNFGEAESATSAIENLNGSIEALIALLGDIFNIETETNAPASQLLIEALTGAVEEIPTSKTVTINAIDNVSGPVAMASLALEGIDGMSADTYITTHYLTTGTKDPGLAAATGTTIPFDAQPVIRDIPRFAGGGTLALVGEAGPELVTLPSGSQVTHSPATRTRLREMERRGSGGPAFYGPVTMQFRGDTSLNDVSSAAIRRGRR